MQAFEIREAITLENHGQKMFGILHRPLHKEAVPGIVICPGFGGNKCGKHRIFVSLAEELTKQGMAVFRFDYRGTGDSEGEFQEITLESKISDTLTALNFLKHHPQLDSNRIGLLGRSLGGAIAVVSARRDEGIKSLALWAPVFTSDPWKELWDSIQSNQLDSSKQEMIQHLYPHIPNKHFLGQFFLLDLVTELQALKAIPLLHIHGEKDQVVKIEQATAYEKARQGIEKTRFIQLPHSDHDFSYVQEQQIAIKETCSWFKQTL